MTNLSISKWQNIYQIHWTKIVKHHIFDQVLIFIIYSLMFCLLLDTSELRSADFNKKTGFSASLEALVFYSRHIYFL